MYVPLVSEPSTVSQLASAMRAAIAFAVPHPSLELGTLRIMLAALGFDQARDALAEGARLIATSR
jgi:hypothetical protein